jgi:hypothetical protein
MSMTPAEAAVHRSRMATGWDRLLRALDPPALAAGAAVGTAALLAVALVAAQVEASTDDDGSTGPLAAVLLVLAVLGLGAAGAVAARRCRRAPLAHGTGAALAAVTAVEIGAILRQVVAGDGIAWWPVAAWLLLGLAGGIAGGLAVLRAPRPRGGADSSL